MGHAAARAQLWPGSRANLGLARTWVARGPGSRVGLGLTWWCSDSVVAWSSWIGLWVLLCFKEFSGALKCWFEVLVFSGGLNCWCFISLKIALINRVSYKSSL